MLAQLIILLLSIGINAKNVMPWMCLERCGEDIQPDLNQLNKHKDVLTAVSFEDYDLGPNSTFIFNNFTSVNGAVHNMGLQSFPMITTVNLTYLRELFGNSEPFINDAITAARQNNYTGYNIDFEPTDAATSHDALQYATFLGEFADALHKDGRILQVCVASWNTFWNFTYISQSSVDRVITMDTYAGEFSTFQTALEFAVQTIGIEKLGVGLETENPNTNQPFSTKELKERFDMIKKYGANEVDIWDTPIPDNFWAFLKAFHG